MDTQRWRRRRPVDHRAVAADVGLHHMRGNDIRQDLLRDVVRLPGAQQVAVEHGLHAGQAADAGALRAGHHARVHPAHQLGRVKPEDRNASTVATMFHRATRSTAFTMSG